MEVFSNFFMDLMAAYPVAKGLAKKIVMPVLYGRTKLF
jgi:hypothetical protein